VCWKRSTALLLNHFINEDFANFFIHSPSAAGDIHIWDRESAALLHHVRAQVVGGDLTCLAWNPAADPFMFATGSHDGSLRIWTTVDRSSHPSPYIYPEFTFQSEGRSGGTPRTRSPSICPPENDNRFGPMNTEGGLRANELRASLDALGAQLSPSTRP
jgi:WD40 repeat protein